MNPSSRPRTDAIFRALLPDACTSERDELRRVGVSAQRINALYPHDFENLNAGLAAYMAAGKRITLRRPVAIHRFLVAKAHPLYTLMPHAAIAENSNAFDSRREANRLTEHAILDYPDTTFNEVQPVEGFAWFVSDNDVQAIAIIGIVNVALLYAQQLSGEPRALAYLEQVVNAYLPDLIEV